jgi:hypothetical protein
METKMVILDPAQTVTATWSALTFLLGLASKGIVDSFLRRRDDAHKLLLDKRIQLLEQQLSQFYWPIYLHLQKDNLIWEKVQQRDQDPDSPRSRLSLKIEQEVILPNHKDALAVIEANLHLAGNAPIVEKSLRFVRHVKVYEMLRAAGIKDDPIAHGEPYPKDYFPAIEQQVNALQAEYDRLIVRLRPADPKSK